MFGIIPKPLWEKVAPSDEFNRIDLALRLLLIKSNNRTILIDTGIGDYHEKSFQQRFAIKSDYNPLEKALNQIKMTCDDVTDLVLSHLHFDHVGGLGKKNAQGQIVPCFPKAKLYLHHDHYQYALSPTQRDQGSFIVKEFDCLIQYYQQKNQIHWLRGNSGPLIEQVELQFITSHGHTPYCMHPYDEKIIYLTDIIPTSHHVRIPWVMGYDISPGISTQDKVRILNFILDKNLTVFYEHDPQFWGGKIKKDAKGQYDSSSNQLGIPSLAYEINLSD